MSLSALPTELKLGFVHYLDPESTLWFALTCKAHAAICKSYLQVHAQRLDQHQSIETDHEGTLLWQFLLEVLDEPSKGWYIRELNLPAGRQYSWREVDRDYRPIPTKDEQNIFRTAAQKLQEFYPVLRPGEENYCSNAEYSDSNDMIALIIDRIEQGHEDGIIILLLHYLPLLGTIRLTAIKNAGLESALYRITRAHKRPSFHLPLRHIKTFAIAHSDDMYCCTANWACILPRLPSLTTLVARQLGNAASASFRDEVASPASNLAEMYLSQCQFDAGKFGAVLGNIKALKRFTYSSGGSRVSDFMFEPKRIIKALSEYAAHSLEELYFDLENWWDVVSFDLLLSYRLQSDRKYLTMELTSPALERRRNRPPHNHTPPLRIPSRPQLSMAHPPTPRL